MDDRGPRARRAERLLTLTAARIDPTRFEVEVAYRLPWKDAFVPVLERAGMRTVCLGGRRGIDPRWALRLRRLLRTQNPPSLLEAMSADMACVTSPVVGIPEVIGDGVEGWLVPPGDPPGLANALVEALGDDGPRASSASAGRIRVDEGSRSNASSTGPKSCTQGSCPQSTELVR